MIKIFSEKNNGGYTLLFSVLVSSILLSIGLAILNISTKEVALSSAARESEIAFYAADAGLECVFRWDLAGKFVIPPHPGQPLASIGILKMCNGIDGTATRTSVDPVGEKTHWSYEFKDNNDTLSPDYSDPCFKVTITKWYNNDPDPLLKTHIESRGYNTCDTGNLRRLERAIKLDY